MNRIFLSCLMLALAGCTTVQTDEAASPTERGEQERANDPLEPVNRAVFAFNMTFDRFVFRPVAKTYITVVPEPAQKGMTNFLQNLMGPWIFLNDMAQGEGKRAGITLARFMINTTYRLAGLFDPAEDMGLPYHDEDMGQTFAVWGIPAGPYVMLPFLGPSDVRDTAGWFGEFFLDPVGIALDHANVANVFGTDFSALSLARFSLDALDFRVRNDELFEELYASDTPYILARSAYRQKLAFDISNGRAVVTDEEEDLFDQDFDY